jgi:hypothetical protein
MFSQNLSIPHPAGLFGGQTDSAAPWVRGLNRNPEHSAQSHALRSRWRDASRDFRRDHACSHRNADGRGLMPANDVSYLV